jgi:uncharacterized protein YhhL (DUF1145 family)
MKMPGWLIVGGKVVCSLMWAVFLLNIVQPFPGGLHEIFLVGGIGIFLIHIMECVQYFKIIRGKGLVLGLDIAQVLLFGIFHVVLLKQRRVSASRG